MINRARSTLGSHGNDPRRRRCRRGHCLHATNLPAQQRNMAADHTEAIERLKSLQENQEIKIIELSNEIRPQPAENGDKRNSAASEMSADDATPASLQADLIHYKVPSWLLRRFRAWPQLICRVGTILKTALQLRRTSHQREIPHSDNCGSATNQ